MNTKTKRNTITQTKLLHMSICCSLSFPSFSFVYPLALPRHFHLCAFAFMSDLMGTIESEPEINLLLQLQKVICSYSCRKWSTPIDVQLIAQLDNLCCCPLGLCIDCIDFHTQITRKSSTAMCQDTSRLQDMLQVQNDVQLKGRLGKEKCDT